MSTPLDPYIANLVAKMANQPIPVTIPDPVVAVPVATPAPAAAPVAPAVPDIATLETEISALKTEVEDIKHEGGHDLAAPVVTPVAAPVAPAAPVAAPKNPLDMIKGVIRPGPKPNQPYRPLH
jgi:hypothetical protein